MIMSDHKLCHSTLKPIGDKEDLLKSFIVFNITSRKPIFRVVAGSQIVVFPIDYTPGVDIRFCTHNLILEDG